MLRLTIDGKEYNFKFGFGFMREIDKLNTATENGIKKDVGMQMAIAGIIDGDVSDLVNVLYYGSRTEDEKPTKTQLEAFIEDAETDVDELFESVLDFLKRANVTKKKTMQLLEMWEAQQKKANQ